MALIPNQRYLGGTAQTPRRGATNEVNTGAKSRARSWSPLRASCCRGRSLARFGGQRSRHDDDVLPAGVGGFGWQQSDLHLHGGSDWDIRWRGGPRRPERLDCPSKRRSNSPGYVRASGGLVAVVSFRRPFIVVSRLTVCGGCTMTITYADATAPSVGKESVFRTRASAMGTDTMDLAKQPMMTVAALPSAPNMTSVSPGIDQLTVHFKKAKRFPKVTSYTATCGPSRVEENAPVSSIEPGGLARCRRAPRRDSTSTSCLKAVYLINIGPSVVPLSHLCP